MEAAPITHLNRLVAGLVVARAADIARAGDYEAARFTLSALTRGPCADAGALDLLARICAQEGRLAEAKEHWERALLLEPNGERYKCALKRIATLEANPLWFRLAPALMIVATLILLGASLYYFIIRVSPRRDSTTQPTAASVIRPQVAEHTSVPEQLKRDLRIEGVLAEDIPDGTLLRFESGLFSAGARLTPSAKLVLARLGRVLEQRSSDLHIKIIGHSDAQPIKPASRFRDATELELTRAISVFQELKRITKIPASAFSISTAGDASPPVFVTRRGAQKQNRPVTIILASS